MRNFKRLLAFVLAVILTVGTFSTVSAARAGEEKWYQNAINYLQNIGVDYISPSQAEMKITREEFVLWIAKIESHQLLDEAWDDEIWLGSDIGFSDVHPGEDKFAAIAYAHQSGFIMGEDDDGDGVYTFAPDRNIILGEVAAIIVRLMGYDDKVSYEGEENWAYNYMRAAQHYCNAFDATFLEETKHYDPYAEVTYGEAAYIIATIMNQTGSTVSCTADGIKLNTYFDTVESTNREGRYFVTAFGKEVLLQCVDCDETISVSETNFKALVRAALGMAADETLDVTDVLDVGSLVNVIKNKKTGKIEKITFESTDKFTTVLNTYLLQKTAEGLKLNDSVSDFYWSNIVVDENEEVKSAQLCFRGQIYTVTNGDDSDLVFYSKNMTGEKLSVKEAIGQLLTASEGCVYAVFSSVAEKAVYKEERNEYGQVINVIDTVKYDTVVIKEKECFVTDFHNDGKEFSFVIKTASGEIVNAFAPSAIKTGIIEKVSVYAEDGYYLVNIRLNDNTLMENIKLPATKADRMIEYTYAYKGSEKKYSYNLVQNFPMLDEAEEAIKAGIVSGTVNLSDATSLWLNDRCVQFAVGEGNEAVYLASAFEKVENTGFVSSASPVDGLENTFDVVITVLGVNGVYDVVEETVRARASSMFDLANYRVYAKIWNDSLLHPNAKSEGDRVEGETDLIYVNVCKDAMSRYLICNAAVSYKNDWIDMKGGHKLGEVVYKTEYTDKNSKGADTKMIVYVAEAIGYEPYYVRTAVKGSDQYTYTLKYARVELTNAYKLVSSGLMIDWKNLEVLIVGTVNGSDENPFVIYDPENADHVANYTEEDGYYITNAETVITIAGQKINIPVGAVLKVFNTEDIKFLKDSETNEYQYVNNDIRVDFTEAEKTTVTLYDLALSEESFANAWNTEVVFGVNDVEAKDIELNEQEANIVFGKDQAETDGVYIDVENEKISAYRVAEDAKVIFVIPSLDGFDCLILDYSDLAGKGVFAVEWNAKIVDNEITAIAMITDGMVFENAAIPEIRLPEATLPEEPETPVEPPVGPTYDIVDSIEGVELAEGCTIVYFNQFANLTAETVHNGKNYHLVIRIEGAVSIKGELQDSIICYELDMNSGNEEFGFNMNLEQLAGMVKGNFYVVKNGKIVEAADVVTAGKLMTKHTEVLVIEGQTVIRTETAGVYAAVENVTFVTVNSKGNLETTEGTLDGLTEIEYIAIGNTVYVIR